MRNTSCKKVQRQSVTMTKCVKKKQAWPWQSVQKNKRQRKQEQGREHTLQVTTFESTECLPWMICRRWWPSILDSCKVCTCIRMRFIARFGSEYSCRSSDTGAVSLLMWTVAHISPCVQFQASWIHKYLAIWLTNIKIKSGIRILGPESIFLGRNAQT